MHLAWPCGGNNTATAILSGSSKSEKMVCNMYNGWLSAYLDTDGIKGTLRHVH